MNLVVLQIDFGQRLEVLELLQPDSVIAQINAVQVLEVAQIFFYDFNNVLGSEFALYRLVRQFDSARKQDEESVEELSHLLSLTRFVL